MKTPASRHVPADIADAQKKRLPSEMWTALGLAGKRPGLEAWGRDEVTCFRPGDEGGRNTFIFLGSRRVQLGL